MLQCCSGASAPVVRHQVAAVGFAGHLSSGEVGGAGVEVVAAVGDWRCVVVLRAGHCTGAGHRSGLLATSAFMRLEVVINKLELMTTMAVSTTVAEAALHCPSCPAES